jgi:hypothetical protein
MGSYTGCAPAMTVATKKLIVFLPLDVTIVSNLSVLLFSGISMTSSQKNQSFKVI